jgi:YVTN family beta-propeller protein
VAATVRVGGAPDAVCYDSTDNRVYCVTRDSGTLIAIDGASDTVMATIAIGTGTLDVCWSPQHNRVFTSNHNTADVSVVDCASNTVMATVPTDDGPNSICYNPQDDKIYTANGNNNTVTVLYATAGVVAGREPQAEGRRLGATIVHGELNLQVGSRQHTEYRAELLDAAGRMVMDLRPGANDVSGFVPGVYFVREAQAQAQAQVVQKVIVTR